MTDPHAPIAGALTGAGLGSMTMLLGAQVDALVLGLSAALFTTIWLESIDSRLKAASAVLFSALLAGYGSPVAAGYLADAVPAAAKSAEALRLLLAVVIGGAAPSLVPLSLRYLGGRLKGGQT